MCTADNWLYLLVAYYFLAVAFIYILRNSRTKISSNIYLLGN